MLTVQLEVPSDKENSSLTIVDDEDLHEILNACGKNVFDPDLGSGCYLKDVRILYDAPIIGDSALDVAQLRARLGDDIVVEHPGPFDLAVPVFKLL